MKAIEQYFHVVLFIIMPYKVVLKFNSVDKTLVCDHSPKQYSHVVLFIMLYKVVLTFKCVTGQKKVLSCGTVYYAVQKWF